jgi:hypothetical protein
VVYAAINFAPEGVTGFTAIPLNGVGHKGAAEGMPNCAGPIEGFFVLPEKRRATGLSWSTDLEFAWP